MRCTSLHTCGSPLVSSISVPIIRWSIADAHHFRARWGINRQLAQITAGLAHAVCYSCIGVASYLEQVELNDPGIITSVTSYHVMHDP